MISSTFVVNTASSGVPELTVQRVNPAGHDVGAPAHIEGGVAGSTIVDPELTPLAHGGEVLTWLEAFSHGLQAHYAVLNPAGRVIADAAYGAADSTAFEAVALPNGGFGLADAETNLFGTSGLISFQAYTAHGSATGGPVTIESETGHMLSYADLEGRATPHGVELAWSEPSGAHSAVLELTGHGHHHDAGLFLT